MIAGIIEILSENTPLVALLGTDKIFPLVVNENTAPPYLAVSLAATGANYSKQEVSSMDFPVVNINVHAKDYDSLEQVSEAVRVALDEQQSLTDAGYEFDRIYFINAFDRADLYTVERPLYARSVQFNVIVRR